MFDEAKGYVLEDPVQPPSHAGQTGYPGETAPSGRSDRPSGGNPVSVIVSSKIVEDEVGDCRTPLVKYLKDPKSVSDRKVRRWALKFILDGNELYRWTADDLLLKCLGPDQARLAMAELHEGIRGTHQSAPKMKWLLRRACFYWPTMIADCFRYYKGCEECQKYGDVQLVPAALLHPIIKPWGLDFIGKILQGM
jgi:hypothetical protein